MKLLLEKNIPLAENSLNLKLTLDDEYDSETKKDTNVQAYILYISIPKGVKVKNTDIAKNIQDMLYEYFLNPNEEKKALYLPKTHEISEFGEGFIDIFYDLRFMHPVLDNGLKTDDDEIGKNLMWIDLDKTTKTTDIIKIEFKSLFLVDELYNYIYIYYLVKYIYIHTL